MANKVFAANVSVGGGADAVDGIRITDEGVTYGDICILADMVNETCTIYYFKDDNAQAEAYPVAIKPDYSTGTTAYTGSGFWKSLEYDWDWPPEE